MSIQIGVDLGTTFTAAAVAQSGTFDMIELGNRANSVPSVVFVEPAGELIVGEAALRRSRSAPSRLAREYKRRIGDPTPISLGGQTQSAESLTMAMLAWVVDLVSERMGERPDHVVIAYPANWGDYKRDLLLEAAAPAGLGDIGLSVVTEPEAAVVHYAAQARVAAGAQIAVYDLGGGTFDAAVVRKTDAGAELMGQPEGIERLGGIDFDEAVFAHVVRALGSDMPAMDNPDDTLLAAAARLREECVRAKEALSADTEVDIPVLLPGVHTQVRLTRTEFEGMIRAPLNASIAALRRAIASAGIGPDELDAVLLVGGSSRIPLVAEMVGSELGRPVAVDAHPKHAVALGAAMLAAEAATGASPADVAGAGGGEEGLTDDLEGAAAASVVGMGVAANAPADTAAEVEVDAVPDAEVVAPGGPGVPEVASSTLGTSAAPEAAAVPLALGGQAGGDAYVPGEPSTQKRSGPPWALIGIAAVVLAAVIGVVVALSGGGDGGTDVATSDADADGDGAEDADDTVVPTAEATPVPTEAPTSIPDPTATPEPTATTEPTPTPTPVPVCPPEVQRCIEITDVVVDGDALVVTWDANGFVPSIADFHAHFYWNVHDAEQVGGNFADFGVEQGSWAAVAAQPWASSTSAGFALSQRPAEATEICVTVGTSQHFVDDPSLFDCRPIPA